MQPISYEKRKIALENNLKGLSFYKALKAFNVMLSAHDGQMRDNGIPYAVHPISIALSALLLKEIPNELLEDLLCVILLHDTIEDCGYTHSKIAESFGVSVADAVLLMSKKGVDVPIMDETERLDRMTKMLLAGLAKGLDRCNNLEDMIEMSLKRQQKYIKESPDIYRMLKKLEKNYPEYHASIMQIRQNIRILVKMTDVNVKNCLAYEERIATLEIENTNLKEKINSIPSSMEM